MRRMKGFATLEVVLIVIIVALIGFVVWRVLSSSNPETVIDQSTIEQQNVPAVNKATDIDTLDAQLDETDVAGSYDSELEKESDF